PRVIVMSVQLLHGHQPGLKLVHHFNYTIVQTGDPLGHVSSFTSFGAADDAGLADERAAHTDFEDGVTGGLQTGVDAEDARTNRMAVDIGQGVSRRQTRPLAAWPSSPSRQRQERNY